MERYPLASLTEIPYSDVCGLRVGSDTRKIAIWRKNWIFMSKRYIHQYRPNIFIDDVFYNIAVRPEMHDISNFLTFPFNLTLSLSHFSLEGRSQNEAWRKETLLAEAATPGKALFTLKPVPSGSPAVDQQRRRVGG